MSTDTRSRAASVLGLAPGASADDATGAFLAALPGVEFLPPGDAVAALNTLASKCVPADSDGETGLSFREQVDEFARRFWSLAPVERLAAWIELGERAADDATTTRLLALQPGLEVPADAQPDPIAEEVAALVRELFVLPPRERAIRRNDWLLANAARHADLSRAAAELKRLRPDLAALEPLLAKLEPSFQAAAFADAATAKPLDLPKLVDLSPSSWDAPTPEPERGEKVSAGDWAQGCGAVWIVIVLGFLLLRACGGVRSDRPRDNYPDIKVPKITMPEFKPVVPGPPPYSGGFGRVSPFTPEQVEAFKEYSEHRKGIPPAWYVEWVRAGRPKAGQPVILPPRPPFGKGQ